MLLTFLKLSQHRSMWVVEFLATQTLEQSLESLYNCMKIISYELLFNTTIFYFYRHNHWVHFEVWNFNFWNIITMGWNRWYIFIYLFPLNFYHWYPLSKINYILCNHIPNLLLTFFHIIIFYYTFSIKINNFFYMYILIYYFYNTKINLSLQK